MTEPEFNDFRSESRGRFDKLESKLAALDKDVGAINTTLKVVGAIVVIAAGIIWYAATMKMEQVARDVVRQESRDRQTVSQDGVFSDATLVAGSPNIFEWKLKEHLDPGELTDIRVDLSESLPGAMVIPALSKDGTHCQMRVQSDAPLPLPLKARAYFTLAAK